MPISLGGDTIDLSAGGDNEVTLTVFASGGHNTVTGGGGADRLTLVAAEDATSGQTFWARYTPEGGEPQWIDYRSSFDRIDAFAQQDGMREVWFGQVAGTSASSRTTIKGVETVSYIGGAGSDLMIGFGGDETFRGGLGNDVVFGNGGHNTIIGTLAELNGDTILDLTWRDMIVAEGVELSDHNVVFDVERTRLVISPDGEEATFHINLRGEFLPDAFSVSVQEGVTEIRYLGGRPFDLGDVSDVALEAVQDGPLVSGVLFPEGSPASLSITAVNGVAIDGVVELAGILGLFRISANGAFEYDPNAAQRLAEGVVEGDVFVATVMDEEDRSTEVTIEINVTGINDPASISGDTTGAVTEDDPARQQASGVLTVTDPDAGEDRFKAPDPADLQGAFGVFEFDPETGAWSYLIDNAAPAVIALDAGEEVIENLTVTSLDGTASETITITVTGSGVREPEAGEFVELSGLVADRAGTELAGTAVTFRPDDGGNASQMTDATGRFAFELPTGSAGHLDATREYGVGDPAITTASALEALRMAVGLNPSWGPAGPMDFIAADFNGDGQVSTADALGILRVAVGLAAEDQPRWIFVDSEADLSHVSRADTQVDNGLRLDPVTADTTDLGLTGILVGHVQEYV